MIASCPCFDSAKNLFYRVYYILNHYLPLSTDLASSAFPFKGSCTFLTFADLALCVMLRSAVLSLIVSIDKLINFINSDFSINILFCCLILIFGWFQTINVLQAYGRRPCLPHLLTGRRKIFDIFLKRIFFISDISYQLL